MLSRRPNIVILIFILLLPFSGVPQAQLKSYQDVNYSAEDPELQSLDIYSYENLDSLRPVVIYFHGGGWSIGDKNRKVKDKISLFQELGYVFISANYRLSPFPLRPDNPDRIKFPVHNRDVAKSIKWVHDSISNYGGNPEKIVLIGHSAGAHLVSLTGTNERFLQEVGLELSNVKGIVSLDGACFNVPEVLEGKRGRRMYLNAFGDDEEANIAASPIFHIDEAKNHPNFLVVGRGAERRLRQMKNFVQRLREENVKVSYIEALGYTHSEVNSLIGEKKDKVITPVLIDFLRQCFNEN